VTTTLRIGRIEHGVTVLGPGTRSVVWVAGCDLACPECITPELWDAQAGTAVPAAELVTELAAHATDGVTWTGGEPFDQASAIAAVCRALRARRADLSLMSYSGYSLEHLRQRTDDGARDLLELLDLLIDGRYIRRRHAPLRWRGSSNQRIHLLSPRHAHVLGEPDEPAGLHRHVSSTGGVRFTGVPPVPNFRVLIEAQLGSDHGGQTR
jgi:anaerobic ribonucleoside-triphosphate reductase activating protein